MQDRNVRFDPQDRPNSKNQPGIGVPAKGDSSESNPPADPEATIIDFPGEPSDPEATMVDAGATHVDADATLVDLDATMADGVSPPPSTGQGRRVARLQVNVSLLQTGDVLGGRYE